MPSRNKIVIPTLAVSQKCGQEEDEDNDDDEEGSSPTLPKFEIVMLLNYFGDNRQLDHIVATDELAMSSCTTTTPGERDSEQTKSTAGQWPN